MQVSEILYEPTPIARIGIRKKDQEVVWGQDFSCFAHLLEEYIAFGVVNIVIPNSAPEVVYLNQMPSLLRKRIKIIDDKNEIETTNRVFFELRKEFGVEYSESEHRLIFKKETPKELVNLISRVHKDLNRMALGFNNNLKVEVNPKNSIKCLKELRRKTSDKQSRIILAQLEALFKVYTEVIFEAPTPPKDLPPKEIISIFDRLINDKNYLDYSNAINSLSIPSSREIAIVELREIERSIRSSNFFSSGWDYFSKVLKVWTGVPIPDSGTIGSLIKNKSLPSLLTMDEARKKAVDGWKSSEATSTPLSRDGKPISDNSIFWLPPLESMDFPSLESNYQSLGTVKDLLKALVKAEELLSKNEKPQKKD